MFTATPSSSAEGRQTGVPSLGRVDWGAHVCQFYRTEQDLTEILVPFFRSGLEHNERCLWITCTPLDAAAARAALHAVVPNLAELEARHQIDIVDYGEDLVQNGATKLDTAVAGWLKRERQARARGFEGLRLSGNFYLLQRQRPRGLAECVTRIHQTLASRRIVALSSYAIDECDTTGLLDILRSHGVALAREAGEWTLVRSATALLVGATKKDPDLDMSHILEHFEQRTRALESEVARARQLDIERRRLLMAERNAVATAEAATGHLARLQRVTSALCQAATVRHIEEIVAHEVAAAAGAARAELSFPPDASTRDGGADSPRCSDLRPNQESAAHIALPVILGARWLGTIDLEYKKPRRLSHADIALLEDLARQLAISLDRASTFERAERSRHEAEEANRVKDEFLAMLGHELRNPLAPMQTAVELMRISAANIAVKEREVIERQLTYMTRLVDDLLDVSRITRGQIQLSKRSVPIHDIIAAAIETASPLLEERSHVLSTSFADREARLEADPHRLSQALANLLTNAAKYTPNGGHIRVSAEIVGDWVRISISDDGIGIEPDLLPHIFTTFAQGRQAVDRAGGGLGLGLTIVRRLIELHGGTVTAASDGPGQGSTFTVDIPRGAYQAAGVTREQAAERAAPPTSAAEHPGLKILVVDDNVDAGEMLSEVLAAGGHDVRTAKDGPEALRVIERFRPELALLDIGLPVMDGYELARHLKERLTPAPPALAAVTGYGQASDIARSKAAGFDAHFVKPLDLARVRTLIERLTSQD